RRRAAGDRPPGTATRESRDHTTAPGMPGGVSAAKDQPAVSPGNRGTPRHRDQHGRKTARACSPTPSGRASRNRGRCTHFADVGTGGRNMNALSPDPDADITASLWAARLDGSSLSTADREELDRWLDTHPSHR